MAFLYMDEKARERFAPYPPPDGGDAGRVVEIETGKIRPNPSQPRREFDTEALLSLSESIRRHGILQPPVVRRIAPDVYELIAGERRLRAACLAGMTTIPCLLRDGGDDESAELAIIENLQRRDLDMFEEAFAIATLCEKYRLTQEQVGQKLSVSQSYVANKLRLLRLSEEARRALRAGALTERHARAALRLPPPRQAAAIAHMAAAGMNVAQAERYVEHLLSDEKRSRGKHTGVIKDIRLFYNTVDRAVTLLKEAGIGIKTARRETPDSIEMTIRIEKKNKEKTE